jgi:ABC-2 type transport system permease protein
MKPVLAIAKRELFGFFAGPVGWLCLVGFSLISGLFFALMTSEFSVMATQATFNPYMADKVDLNQWLIQPFFANTAILLLMLAPAVTMRLIAEDRKRGSLELLLASPISSEQIVLGKYMGALGFITAMLLMTVPFIGLLYWLDSPDTGLVLSCYAATWLMAAAFVAVGLLTSAMTENQIVALVIGFGLLLVLWLMSTADSMIDGAAGELLVGISILPHIEQLMKGLLHSKDLVYFVTFIGFFLFATARRVEAYRWR